MQTPKNKYRYTLTDRLGTLIVFPLGEGDFAIEWEPDKDDGKSTYKKGFKGEIIFTGETFFRLYQTELSGYRCEYQYMMIEKKCIVSGSEVWAEFFSARMSLDDGDWDPDRCTVKLKFEEDKPYSCFEDNMTETLDLFPLIGLRRTIKLGAIESTIETSQWEHELPTTATETDPYWGGGGVAGDTGWVAYYKWNNRHFPTSTQGAWWAREVVTVLCPGNPGEEWIMIEDNCGTDGTWKYARPVVVSDCNYFDTNLYLCAISTPTSGVQFDNGLPFDQVIQAFVTAFCPGKTVVSNFFQINPDVVSTTNYVTLEPSKVLLLTLYQKTDVKRPASTGNATKAEWEFGKLMQAIYFMFNVRWRIEGSTFRLEHTSYFTQGLGLNLLASKYDKYTDGKNGYSYKRGEKPKREIWKWYEQRSVGDFPGTPIVYEGACVATGGKMVEKTYTSDGIVTDVEYVLANPASDSGKVSDNGFVLIAAYQDGFDFYVLNEDPILDTIQRPNNTLALAQLMRDYHRYERPMKYGLLNNVKTFMLSTIKTKKGKKISIPFCCGDVFNPNEFVQTLLGQGQVDKAAFNFKTSMLDLDLVYDDWQTALENVVPFASNDTTTTPRNVAKYINVLSNDFDPDSVGQLNVFMYSAPLHGSAVVQPDKTILYTPTPGYFGNDVFSYFLKDQWGEQSNNGLVSITIT